METQAVRWGGEEKLKSSLLLSDAKDRWVWTGNNTGIFSCKNGYELVSKQAANGLLDAEKWSKLTWIKWSPPKINAFIWKLLQDRIPTRVNLRKRKILHEEVKACCILCDAEEEESSSHLFFRCTFSSKIWSCLGKWLETNIDVDGDVKENIEAFSKSIAKKSMEIWLSIWHGTIWYIWLARNGKFFKGKELSHEE